MSVNDFVIAHLTAEQKEKLKKYEYELGCTLIAYEETHEEQSESRSDSNSKKAIRL